MSNSFEELEIDPRLKRAVADMGFETMSPIQEEAIPLLLAGKDIIGQAQTGTGKTAAFGIPLIQRVDPENKELQVVILCPTRELAVQAAGELRRLAKYMEGIKVLPVYGGQEIGRQIVGLKGTQIIVGTPGRVMDHMRRHTIRMDNVKMVVLDEADEMLNMGFLEDMETILGEITSEHQTALFSATMPQPILDITGKFQKDAQLVRIASKELTIPLVTQYYYRLRSQDKDAACVRILEYYQPRLCLIFCNTRHKVDELAEFLKKQGYQAEGLHGEMSQAQRDVAMGRFRHAATNILIATDVAARGIDVDDVEAVINYDLPQDVEYYVHRIGRTGRAGKTGTSYTFLNNREMYKLREIERFCHTTVEERALPGAAKVMKVKAKKFLDETWELKDHEDIELMRRYILQKMEQEGCEALDIAAVMLKYYVGEKGDEIAIDEGTPRRRDPLAHRERRRGDYRRDGNAGREERAGRDERGRRDGESRRGKSARLDGDVRREDQSRREKSARLDEDAGRDRGFGRNERSGQGDRDLKMDSDAGQGRKARQESDAREDGDFRQDSSVRHGRSERKYDGASDHDADSRHDNDTRRDHDSRHDNGSRHDNESRYANDIRRDRDARHSSNARREAYTGRKVRMTGSEEETKDSRRRTGESGKMKRSSGDRRETTKSTVKDVRRDGSRMEKRQSRFPDKSGARHSDRREGKSAARERTSSPWYEEITKRSGRSRKSREE